MHETLRFLLLWLFVDGIVSYGDAFHMQEQGGLSMSGDGVS
jgi:hypothetical protein